MASNWTRWGGAGVGVGVGSLPEVGRVTGARAEEPPGHFIKDDSSKTPLQFCQAGARRVLLNNTDTHLHIRRALQSGWAASPVRSLMFLRTVTRGDVLNTQRFSHF